MSCCLECCGNMFPHNVTLLIWPAELLLKSTLWWKGRDWLCKTEWPSLVGVGGALQRSLPELKATCLTVTAAVIDKDVASDWCLWQKFSCYSKLVITIAWMWRFVNSCRGNKPSESNLTFYELHKASMFFIVKQQKQSLPEVFQYLKQNKQLPNSHPLAGLCVSMTADHTLSARGRVGQKQLTPLSIKNNLTKLLVETEHKK